MKLNFKEIGRNIGGFASEHSPEILTGIGIAGMITTTIIAVNATPKALRLIEDAEMRLEKEELTAREIVGVTWKCYVPAAVTGMVSISCLIGASSVSARRNAALATAYTLSETAMKNYREKVIETLGEEKDRGIRDDIAKDKLAKDPIGNRDVIITNKGGILCYDAAFGRYFESNVDKIKRVENELNRRMLSEMYISLNDFYYELGEKPVKEGDDIGWNIEDGLLDIHFSAQLDENNEPCIVIDYHVAPKHRFDRA